MEIAAKNTDNILVENNREVFMQYKGIDVGTSTLIMAENGDNGEVVIKKERDAFFSLPADDTVTNILDMSGASYIHNHDTGEIYIVGEDALTFANLFNKEARRPMHNGVLSNIDEQAMPMLKALLKGLVGEAPKEGAVLKYSIPADPVNDNFDIVYHEDILNRIFTELGYQASSINEGQCVAYSELGNERFTGISMSFGGGMVNIAVTNLGILVDSFSVRGGGDSIDERVAQNKAGLGWTASKVTKKKENGIDILDPKDEIEEAIAIYYQHLIIYTMKQLKTTLQEHRVANFPEDVVLAIAGGTSLVGNFINVLKGIIDEIKLPVGIKEIRHSKEPLYSVAYGAHMAAGIEAKKQSKE